MAKENAIHAVRKDMFFVPFEGLRIVPDFNVRYDYGDIKELAASIAENGVKVAMKGYKKDGLFYITDGHRRYKAMELLAKKGYSDLEAPFITEERGYTAQDRTMDLLLSNEGKRLTLLEEAHVFDRLINEFGMKPKDIAKTSGKSVTHVENCMLLFKADEKLIEKVKNETVAASTVIEMLRKKDAKEVGKKIEAAEEKLAQSGSKRKKITAKDMETKPRRNISKDLTKMLNEIKEEKKDVNEEYLYFAEKLLEYYQGELDYDQIKSMIQTSNKKK